MQTAICNLQDIETFLSQRLHILVNFVIKLYTKTAQLCTTTAKHVPHTFRTDYQTLYQNCKTAHHHYQIPCHPTRVVKHPQNAMVSYTIPHNVWKQCLFMQNHVYTCKTVGMLQFHARILTMYECTRTLVHSHARTLARWHARTLARSHARALARCLLNRGRDWLWTLPLHNCTTPHAVTNTQTHQLILWHLCTSLRSNTRTLTLSPSHTTT